MCRLANITLGVGLLGKRYLYTCKVPNLICEMQFEQLNACAIKQYPYHNLRDRFSNAHFCRDFMIVQPPYNDLCYTKK